MISSSETENLFWLVFSRLISDLGRKFGGTSGLFEDL